MNGWNACINEWEESHLNWNLGKREFLQHFDHHLRWKGLHRIFKNLFHIPHRLWVCHKEMRQDRHRKQQIRHQFWDELLLGNIWTHTEPILADIKDMRTEWNAHNYTKAGKHFGEALFKIHGGLVPENENVVPMVSVLPSPNELAIGLYYGVTGNVMNGAQELDEQFSADIMAAVEDIATLNGNGITKGFMKAIKIYSKVS